MKTIKECKGRSARNRQHRANKTNAAKYTTNLQGTRPDVFTIVCEQHFETDSFNALLIKPQNEKLSP